MWQGLKAFVYRHRRKFIGLGVTSAGLYALWKYLQYKLEQQQVAAQAEMRAHSVEHKRQRHFDANQRTRDLAVQATIPVLLEELHKQLNAEAIRDELKGSPSNKVQLWDQLKCMSVARVITGVYALSMLAAFTSVQLNILGGHIASKDPTSTAPATDLEAYFKMSSYIVNQGLERLIRDVHHATCQVLADVPLKHRMTMTELKQHFDDIRKVFARSVASNSTPFLQYMLAENADAVDGSSSRLLDETRDIIESADFANALSVSVHLGMTFLFNSMRLHYFLTPLLSHSSVSEVTDEEAQRIAAEPTEPLPKLIVFMTSFLDTLLQMPDNSLLQDMVASDALRQLSRSVFDAFTLQTEETA